MPIIERGAKLDRHSISDFVRISAKNRAEEIVKAEKEKKKARRQPKKVTCFRI